jgi:ribonuclease T1
MGWIEARAIAATGPGRSRVAGVRRVRRARRPFVALVALALALAIGYAVRAADIHHKAPRSSASSQSSATVALSALPPEASTTVARIRAGGPFPFPHNDGVVFHNAEHHLPREPDGWYHEYTVPTPDSDDRGERRIITGRDGRYWYTGDHYASFQQVEVRR